MKIAIIGGGWVGCHLATKLKKNHDITLYEKNSNLFKETSYHNQNRLHYGFHYARNSETRNLCKSTFNVFIKDYGFCVENIEKNYYCVPKKLSLLDFNTYIKIFDDYDIKNVEFNNKTIEGCINTNEKFLNFQCFYDYFNNELKDNIIFQEITKTKIKQLSKKYDLVIDATNNFLGLIDEDFFYELTLTLIYKKIKSTEFDAITLVDGNLFSIYPYKNDMFTLTDVELTPLKKFKNIKDLYRYKKNIDFEFISEKLKKFEDNVEKIIPDFKQHFIYDSYFLSTKSKINDESSGRYPIIKKFDNIVSCFTGKIQGVYIIEDYINKLINLQD